jgi:hypothetical protein
MKKSYLILIILAIIAAFISLSSCSDREEPPYIKAEVIDAAGNKTIVNNFKLLYWWEERGETPFLKPHNLYTKELIVEIEKPIDNNPKKISVSTERFSLQDLERILIINTETGYDINIETKAGDKILATDNFPRTIKKGEDTGLADHIKYAYGSTIKDGKKIEFKKSFNILTEIRIVEVKNEKYQ